MSETDGDSSAVVPLDSSPEVVNEREVADVPEKDSYAVPRPLVGDTHVESIAVTLADNRVVVFSEPDGALDESRIFPDVIEFQRRDVYDTGAGEDE